MPTFEEKSVNYTNLIGSDFKNLAFSRKGRRHHFPYSISIAVTFIAVIIVSVVLAHTSQSTLNDPDPSNTTEVALTIKPLLSEVNDTITNHNSDPLQEIETSSAIKLIPSDDLELEKNKTTVVVKKGDTLASIFAELAIHNELTRLLNLGKQAKPFKKIYPGQKLHFTIFNNELKKLELEKSGDPGYVNVSLVVSTGKTAS